MATKEMEAAEQSYEAAMRELLESLPAGKLHKLLPVKRLLQELTPEEIVDALSPEARAELLKKLRH